MMYDFNGFPNLGSGLYIEEVQIKDRELDHYKKIELTKESIPKYIAMEPTLKHVRIADNTEAYLFLDNFNGDRPLAVLCVETKSPQEKWIQALEVFKGYRRKGFGKQLAQMAHDKLGANYLSVRENNEKAIHLYKLCGYKVYTSKGNMLFMKR